ncbi:MAG: hypothetical protein V1804_00530 [Patescibacteria group bacterium]
MENQTIKESEPKETIHINTGIGMATITTIVPLLGIFMISNTWWGILIKVLLAIIILGMLKNYFFHPMWEKATGFGAGIVLNMIWFAGLWFFQPHWITYVFSGLFILGLITMRYTLKQHYDDAR